MSDTYALELMRKGVDPLLAQARQLGPAIVSPRLVGGGVVHAAGGYWPSGAADSATLVHLYMTCMYNAARVGRAGRVPALG